MHIEDEGRTGAGALPAANNGEAAPDAAAAATRARPLRWRRLLIRLGLLVLVVGTGVLIFWRIVGSGQGATNACDLVAHAAALNDPPLYLGLDAYQRWDKLSYLEIGDRVMGQSTADINLRNSDSSHYLRTLPDGERVLFDQTGPGLVTFMRMQENYGQPWNLTLDGRQTTLQESDLGQFDPTSSPARDFPYPLSLNRQEDQGSSIIAAPIAFKQQLLFTSHGRNGNFYALYRRLPYGAPLPACSLSTTSSVANLLRRAGSDIAPASLTRVQGRLDVLAGRAVGVTTLPGPSQIRELIFRAPSAEETQLGRARLQIYWDNDARPAVDAPLKFLAGDGAGVYQPAGRPLVRGWIAGANGDGRSYMEFHLYWPMPFSSRARILLRSDTPLQGITWSAGYEPFPDPPAWWGTFHATYSDVPHPTPGQDMTFLDVRGSGKLVGTVVNFWKTDGTLEGNPSLYLDDSRTPQIEVTGTEEWGLGGDYWHGGQQTSLPLGGLPSSQNNPPGAEHDGAALYRFLIADSIPFNRHIIVRWQHGSVDQGTHPYRAAVFWYGRPEQTALLNDEILPASASSRFLHSYQATDESSYTLRAGDIYTLHGHNSSGTGTRFSGSASFRVTLDPRNHGAFLRRLYDYCVANQRANIFVDGHYAGMWYSAGSSNRPGPDGVRRCWREEDFPLPASLTAGHATLTIRVAFVSTADPFDSAWTAFRYQVYSFVMNDIKSS